MLTLKQIKDSSIANVAGVNVESSQFTKYVNDAVRMLIELGDWWSTVKVMRGCVYDSLIVWPQEVATVLALNQCKEQLPVYNYWYQFVDERWSGNVCSRCDNPSVVEYGNTTCVFRQQPTERCYIQFRITNPADVGKTVTIYGQDENGLDIVVPLTLASPLVESPLLSKLTNITKDITAGNVLGYWRTVDNKVTPCGIYKATTQSPQFITTQYHNPPRSDTMQITALVKMNFEPMAVDSDLCLIDSLDAIKSMVQAIRAREAGDDAGGDKYEVTAVRRLNAQIRNRFPDHQITINLNPFGTAYPSRYDINRIV